MSTVTPSPEALRAAAASFPLLPRAVLPAGETIGVAVSGGADSVYLLCALWADVELRPRLRVVHFDHRVRGAESAGDVAFVQQLCAALAVPCLLGVRAGTGLASEAELRAERQAFFAEQRRVLEFQILATAHHLDDVTETMLMRLARGAGLAGLSAPRVWQTFRDRHVHWRPLIAARLRKADLLERLRFHGLTWREDATNTQPITLRNRVRQWLRQGGGGALGPNFTLGFASSAQHLEQAEAALATWADELGCVLQTDGSMPTTALCGRPLALAHTVLARFLSPHGLALASGSSLEALAAALVAGRDTRASLLAVVVRHQAGRLSLPHEPLALGSHLRSLGLAQVDAESGLCAERIDVDAALWEKLSRGGITPDAEVYLNVPVGADLGWRGRQEGDRYQPLGLDGTAKLSDLLINRKIPKEHRESLPVVLAGEQIIWVPGLPPAAAVRLTGPCLGALRLTWLTPCLSSVLPR